MLNGCFNAYVLPSLEYCALVWMSSVESHFGLLDSIVRSAERLCEGELSCLKHRRKVSALCLLYEIYYRVDHPMNEHLNHLVAAPNTAAVLSVLALIISCCRTDQFTLSGLPAAVHLWNLLPSGVLLNILKPTQL